MAGITNQEGQEGVYGRRGGLGYPLSNYLILQILSNRCVLRYADVYECVGLSCSLQVFGELVIAHLEVVPMEYEFASTK